jgi:replicative DNA helicase
MNQKYTKESLDKLRARLDASTFLNELGVGKGDYTTTDTEIHAYCPVCNDRSKMTLVIEQDSRTAYCRNLYCEASNMNYGGEDLLSMFALILSREFNQAALDLSSTLGITLEESGAGAGSESPVSIAAAALEVLGDFRYVEVGHFAAAESDDDKLRPVQITFEGQRAFGRGLMIGLEQVKDFMSQYRSNVYRSHFLFNSDNREDIDKQIATSRVMLLGDYFVVFKAGSSAEIVHAINQAIDLVERFKQNYDVPYDAVTVYYTSQHISVHIDYTVFGITPCRMLHDIFRRMTCATIGIDPESSERSAAFSQIDLSAYRADLITNIPGTILTIDGREIYKIRMSYSAFKKMSYQRLHEFSLRRPDLPERGRWPEKIIKAGDFFTSFRSNLERDAKTDERDVIANLFYGNTEYSAGISSLKQLAPTLLRRLFDDSRHVLPTLSEHLNRTLSGGLYPGNLYVVAGIPGTGTSTFVLQMMNDAAMNSDAQCLFVGLQRGIEEVFKRSLSYVGGIPSPLIDAKRHKPSELYEDKDFNRSMFSAFEKYQTFSDNITILEGSAAGSLEGIRQLVIEKKEELEAQAASHSSVLLIIDSLQLMMAQLRARGGERSLNSDAQAGARDIDVDILTSHLKAMARELDITIVATFEYFSRGDELQPFQENSAAILDLLHSTQFADTVFMITRLRNNLSDLKDYYKVALAGTPLEGRIASVQQKLAGIEQKYLQTEDFRNMQSEFSVLDIVKNRIGITEKVLYIHNKPISTFTPLEYLNGGW